MTEILHYEELGMSILPGAGSDTTDDRVRLHCNGEVLCVENDLRYEPGGIKTVAGTLGIKQKTKPDFTVMQLEKPCAAAAVFTTCRSPSYTVIRNREVMRSGLIQGIAVNSGNANVYTPSGADDLAQCASLIAKEFNLPEERLLVCSTGVIGVRLPVERFQTGVPGLAQGLASKNLGAAATAILTTDLGPKVASFRHGDLLICGIAKGAGMIEPHLATMLVYLYTNAALTSEVLQSALIDAVDVSFNSISIDTDTSTSDAVSLVSTGAVVLDAQGEECFRRGLRAICVKLARDIVSQGEGVSKIIECTVRGDLSPSMAKRLAKQIINSPLVKTAVHGADPNWGRVVAALGKPQPVVVEPLFPEESVEIAFAGVPVFLGGRPVDADLEMIRRRMREEKNVPIDVRIGVGGRVARVWGCDLTEEYVTYNSDYTS